MPIYRVGAGVYAVQTLGREATAGVLNTAGYTANFGSAFNNQFGQLPQDKKPGGNVLDLVEAGEASAGPTVVDATANDTWSGWTATSSAVVEHAGTANDTWSGWTATSSAVVEHAGTANDTWSGWTATATGEIAAAERVRGGRRVKVRVQQHPQQPFLPPVTTRHGTATARWGSWRADAVAAVIDDSEVLELILVGAL